MRYIILLCNYHTVYECVYIYIEHVRVYVCVRVLVVDV